MELVLGNGQPIQRKGVGLMKITPARVFAPALIVKHG
jgi:hypothetical protein